MKGREIINNAVRAKMPDREQVKENCLRQAVPEKQKAKRPALRRSVFTAATAAVLVICIMFGNMLMNPKIDNIFTLKAYAMEQQADGSIELREIDLLNDLNRLAYYHNGEYIHVNIGCGIRIDGDNIKSMELIADDCVFATQLIVNTDTTNPETQRVPMMGVGNTITMYGHYFEPVGNVITLTDDLMTENFLLFIMQPMEQFNDDFLMTFHAVVTFNNGEVQERRITVTSENLSVGVRTPTPEELERRISESEKYQELLHSIPLEKCEVVPGSLQILSYGDTFEFNWGDSATSYHPVTKESMDSAVEQGLFDENGIFRQSSNLPDDGSDGYIAVIENNGDGTFNGMVYKVPGQLILDNMK